MATGGRTTHLFGGYGRPWDQDDWTSSDDRVRGGQSISHLDIIDHASMGRTTQKAARFWGHLDITALGGAGFASQHTVDSLPPLDLASPGYEALVLGVVSTALASPEEGSRPVATYTVVLKDTLLPRRPDGREQSTVSWECDFDVPRGDEESGGGGQVVLPLCDFQPTYRGQPKEDADPLDLKSVKRMSLMVRSFFGKQEGDFEMIIKTIGGWKRG